MFQVPLCAHVLWKHRLMPCQWWWRRYQFVFSTRIKPRGSPGFVLYLVHFAQLEHHSPRIRFSFSFLSQDGPPTGSGAPEGQLQQQMPSKWNALSVRHNACHRDDRVLGFSLHTSAVDGSHALFFSSHKFTAICLASGWRHTSYRIQGVGWFWRSGLHLIWLACNCWNFRFLKSTKQRT